MRAAVWWKRWLEFGQLWIGTVWKCKWKAKKLTAYVSSVRWAHADLQIRSMIPPTLWRHTSKSFFGGMCWRVRRFTGFFSGEFSNIQITIQVTVALIFERFHIKHCMCVSYSIWHILAEKVYKISNITHDMYISYNISRIIYFMYILYCMLHIPATLGAGWIGSSTSWGLALILR